MTSKVFCKNCKWYKEAKMCVPVPFLNPVTGDLFAKGSYRSCEIANANYNCPHHTPKDGGEGE